jgi:hypothetical protein
LITIAPIDMRERALRCAHMDLRTMRSSLGLVGGAALAPLTALGSRLRHARLFHPRGIVLRGVAVAARDGAPELRAVGERLAGPVFARFSGAWWKERQWPDVLGCALRFSASPELELAPVAGDQDLLLATIRSPLTTLLAPLGTHFRDYLSNCYFGVSPFVVAPLGRVKLRLAPERAAPSGESRAGRIVSALACGPVGLLLQARADHLGSRYRTVARIELHEAFTQDPRSLRFDPFAHGRGLEPVGVVHALRVASYAASQRARAAQ